MSKNIKSVVLHFENCDDFTIDSDNIAEFYLGDFEKYYSRAALNWIGEFETSKKFYIHIHKDANTNEKRNVNYSDDEPFDRIRKYDDITQVELIYEDETQELFQIRWGGDDEYINECQKSILNDSTGDLYIVIGEDLKIEDVFTFDDESSNFYWEMIKA